MEKEVEARESCQMKDPREVMRAPDAVYIGETEEGLPSGHGRLTIMRPGSKTVLDGSFRDGKMHGFSVCVVIPDDAAEPEADNPDTTLFRGSCFAGSWHEGKRDGQGLMSYADGTQFDGNYKNGLKHGLGMIRWPDGATFFGNFKGGKAIGPGELTFANGTRYVGEFQGKDWRPRGTVHLSFPVQAVLPEERERRDKCIVWRGGFSGAVPEGTGSLEDEKGDVLKGIRTPEWGLNHPEIGTFCNGKLSGWGEVKFNSSHYAREHGQPEVLQTRFLDGVAQFDEVSFNGDPHKMIGGKADDSEELARRREEVMLEMDLEEEEHEEDVFGYELLTSPEGRRAARDDEGKQWESSDSGV